MYKSILVPLDGSLRAERVLFYVEELARRFAATLTLIQVVEPHIEFHGSQVAHHQRAIEEFRQETRQAEVYLNQLKDQLQEKGIQAHIEVAHGDAVKPIISRAAGRNVDLIALASHGRGGLAGVFYGSVAAAVLQQVDRPLLLIRSHGEVNILEEEAQQYRSILVPLDGSERAEKILPYVEQLALGFSARVVFLQVLDPGIIYLQPYTYHTELQLDEHDIRQVIEDAEKYLADLQGKFLEKGIQSRILISEGSVVKTIIAVAKLEEVDLIAMASHGRTGLARVFYGSVAAGILNQVDRPLLLIRAGSLDV